MKRFVLGLICIVLVSGGAMAQTNPLSLEQKLRIQQEKIEAQVLEATGKHYKTYLENNKPEKKGSYKQFWMHVLLTILFGFGVLGLFWACYCCIKHQPTDDEFEDLDAENQDLKKKISEIKAHYDQKNKVTRLLCEGINLLHQNHFESARERLFGCTEFDLDEEERFEVHYYLGASYGQEFYILNNIQSHAVEKPLQADLKQTGLLQKGEHYMQKALEVSPQSADAVYALGLFARYLDRRHDARTYLERSRTLFGEQNRPDVVEQLDTLLKYL